MTRRLGDESGITVVAALVVTLIGLLFTAAAVGSAISTESSVRRDGAGKRALQAAKAGAQSAALRLSALSEGLTGPGGVARCPVSDGAGGYRLETADRIYGGARWCQPVTEKIGAAETATYWVSDDQEPTKRMTDSRDIVAIGALRAGARRVKTHWTMFDIRQLFWDYAVFSDRDLYLDNQADVGSPTITGNARSNGSIHLGNPGNVIYGDATPGPGGTVDDDKGTVAGSTLAATEPLALPAVDVSQAAVNDNGLICSPSCPSGVSFTGGDLVLSGSNVVVRGNTFLLCSLSMTGQGNPTITFEPRDPSRPVRVFIEDQAECPAPRPTAALDVGQKPTVRVLSTAYPSLQIFMAGTADSPPSVSIANRNPSLPITLYAPTANVTIANNGTITGGIAAGSVAMSNSTQVVVPSGGTTLDFEVPPEITPGDFIECTSTVAASATLTEGC